MADVTTMRITTRHGEVACVMSYPNKPCALDAMAVEEGFESFAHQCRELGKSFRKEVARYTVTEARDVRR